MKPAASCLATECVLGMAVKHCVIIVHWLSIEKPEQLH